jgi:GDP-L-fucose synthase
MQADSRILITGHRGLVGSAVVRVFSDVGFTNLICVRRADCDLRDRAAVANLFSSKKPEYVIMCAAKVGGIMANQRSPVEFFTDNARIQMNVMESAFASGVKKLLFLGSACAYPKFAGCPVKESALLTGALEGSNEMYALAKISGVKLCDAYRQQYGCNFISAMPTNLYGVRDTYNDADCHVIPGMIKKFHEAEPPRKPVTLWGTGGPTREFLFSDDLARACLVLLEKYDSPGTVNIGTGQPVMLRQLAELIAKTTGYAGDIMWDLSKPDGTPARGLDSSKMFGLGWSPAVPLERGLAVAYNDFLCRQH